MESTAAKAFVNASSDSSGGGASSSDSQPVISWAASASSSLGRADVSPHPSAGGSQCDATARHGQRLGEERIGLGGAEHPHVEQASEDARREGRLEAGLARDARDRAAAVDQPQHGVRGVGDRGEPLDQAVEVRDEHGADAAERREVLADRGGGPLRLVVGFVEADGAPRADLRRGVDLHAPFGRQGDPQQGVGALQRPARAP